MLRGVMRLVQSDRRCGQLLPCVVSFASRLGGAFRMVPLLAIVLLAVLSTGCGFSRMVAHSMKPGEVRCTNTNSEYVTSRTCYVRDEEDPDNLRVVESTTCVKTDGEVTGCTQSFQ